MQPLKIWLVNETVQVEYPDGQQIPIPLSEIQRLTTILRTQAARDIPVDGLLKFRHEFRAAFTHQDIVKKGAQVRKSHEDELSRTALRKEKEKRQRLKRVEKRDKLKQANELLSLIGL
jgi:hypothetical protein